MPDMHVPPLGEDKLRVRYAAVAAQHAAAARNKRIDTAARNGLLLMLIGFGGWSAWNNNRLADKAAGRETVYAVLQPNGAFVTSTHYSDVVPKGVQEDQVTNALWTYVQARDCYGSQSFIRQAYIAQAMSDQRVGRQVTLQFDLNNTAAPQHVYGEHGTIVQCELIDPPTQIGQRNNQYLFRFRRWEDTGHTTPADVVAAPFYTVTVEYRTGVFPINDERRAWMDKATINAPGVQVIDYPGAKPDNATPVRRPAAGGVIR